MNIAWLEEMESRLLRREDRYVIQELLKELKNVVRRIEKLENPNTQGDELAKSYQKLSRSINP